MFLCFFRNGQGYENCKHYDFNYTYFSTLTYKEAMSELLLVKGDVVETKYCTEGWTFDYSIYQSTLVTEVFKINIILLCFSVAKQAYKI